MAYTVEDIFKRACSLVDSLTDAGDIDASTTADYRGRSLTLVDMCQKELLKVSDNYSKYEIALRSIPNLLGVNNYFDVREYKGVEDVSIEAINDEVGSVRAYYFESDGSSGTVYIEDYTTQWNVLDTITLSNTTKGFQAYSGLVTPSTGASKSRIRFSGSFYYKYVNVALYSYPLVTVPAYKQWIPVELPVDLKEIDNVVFDAYDGVYTNEPSYKIEWEGNRQTIYVDYTLQGTLRVEYRPYPVAPTAFTDTISVDDMAAQCIVYYLAMNFIGTEQNEDLRNQFRSQYENLKLEVSRKQPESQVPLLDYYSDTNVDYAGYGRGCRWGNR